MTKPKPRRAKAKRMKPWHGWCAVNIKTGVRHYVEAVRVAKSDAIKDHRTAVDGSGEYTRIARVRVTEITAKPRRRQA